MRVVLITGASSGIGAAAAARLACRGYEVYGASRSGNVGVPTIRRICMDVRDDRSVSDGVAEVLRVAERIDGLVCSAGFAVFGSIEEVGLDQCKEQFETNFFGVLRTIRAVVPIMRAAGGGRIVLVGSLAGRAPVPFSGHYSASKAALDALAQALRIEVGRHGIDVSLVEPGDINTPFAHRTDWSALRGSSYGNAIQACAAVVREAVPSAPGPEVVATAIERALTSRHPRFRYSVGPDSRLVPWARRLLPEAACLALIQRRFITGTSARRRCQPA